MILPELANINSVKLLLELMLRGYNHNHFDEQRTGDIFTRALFSNNYGTIKFFQVLSENNEEPQLTLFKKLKFS